MWNLPNAITLGRLGGAIVFFVFLSLAQNASAAARPLWLWFGLAVFILAVLSDAVDGYVARRLNLVTAFGRIADPFVDKVLVCGGFVYLVEISGLVDAWMVVLVLAREFTITTIRGYVESQGIPFGADAWGKGKMLLQSIAVPFLIGYAALGEPRGAMLVVGWALLIAALAATVISAVRYLVRASKACASLA
ncbi:MAG: CDP-diacylglycerol--glycerol-3-phosphate 3-phosphatidyltransferase [Planctomycetes bacterium]|nr:CDP-diacylglycerol--glycerol-3-phosphate 3-phosphatidyltransferase [Planctomycetota bacterium]